MYHLLGVLACIYKGDTPPPSVMSVLYTFFTYKGENIYHLSNNV